MQDNTKRINTEQEVLGHNKLFWPMLAVFYALFVVRNVFLIEFPVSVYLIWIIAMGLLFKDTEMKALLIAFIPLAPGFQSKYAVLICMVFLLIRYFKKIKVPLFVFIIPILMLWEYFHKSEGFFSTAEYLSGFAPLMCLMILVSLPKKEEDASFFTRVLAVSVTVGSLIMIFNTVNESGQSLLSLIQEGFRFGLVEGEEVEEAAYQISYNANALGYLCNLGIAGLLINIYLKKAKVIDYILLSFLILVGCLTVSRTFLLCLAGTFVLYILMQKKSGMKKAGTFLLAALILVIAIFVLQMTMPGIIQNYVTRFNADDITGGRANLYDFYNDFIFSSPKYLLYGIGMQGINLKVWNIEGVLLNVPHNGYQQMVLAWGVVGLVLMMVFLICLAIHAQKRNPRVPVMCYLPLILLLTNIFAGQFITSGTKLLSLVFIYLVICNGGKEREKG